MQIYSKRIWCFLSRSVDFFLKLTKHFSNHYACLELNTLCFEHFINLRVIRFLHWLKNSTSLCFLKYRSYFLTNSLFLKNVSNTWKIKYDFDCILGKRRRRIAF